MRGILFFVVIFLIASDLYSQARLQDLEKLELTNATITKVERIVDGTFELKEQQKNFSGLPPFVRVAVTARPTSESNIRIGVWMPEEEWNGRFLGTGNGGGAGSINYGVLIAGLKRGFAVANTDMGTHPGAMGVIDYPERWKDFGYRATHEMTTVAKKIIQTNYNREIAYSYFSGCSTGGQQALMEAQRFPEDYDGIIAGAPANNRTHLHTGFLWNYRVITEECGCEFTPEEIEQISEIILDTNLGKDGGAPTDRFFTDPRVAQLDYGKLQNIVSKEKINALEKIFSGPVNPVTGETIYTGFPLGSENQGAGLNDQQKESFGQAHFYPFYWAGGRDFNYREFDFNKDMDKVDVKLASFLNANDPDLEPFKRRGGKLLMYTGAADAIVPYQDALHYYERVIDKQEGLEETKQFFRYFLIPGMGHCNGGPGLHEFGQSLSDQTPQDPENDILTALMEWVEKGKAPHYFIATTYQEGNSTKGILMQRPVYPYPEFPAYTSGDPSLPTSYEPSVRERGNVSIPAPKYLK